MSWTSCSPAFCSAFSIQNIIFFDFDIVDLDGWVGWLVLQHFLFSHRMYFFLILIVWMSIQNIILFDFDIVEELFSSIFLIFTLFCRFFFYSDFVDELDKLFSSILFSFQHSCGLDGRVRRVGRVVFQHFLIFPIVLNNYLDSDFVDELDKLFYSISFRFQHSDYYSFWCWYCGQVGRVGWDGRIVFQHFLIFHIVLYKFFLNSDFVGELDELFSSILFSFQHSVYYFLVLILWTSWTGWTSWTSCFPAFSYFLHCSV